MTAYQQVVAAWNAQADETNQWDSLGEDEKIEWALKCADQFRGATKMMQAARQALEALEEATNYTSCPSWSPSMTDECNAAIAALREAMTA